MVDEGLISKEEAVARIDPAQLDQRHPMIDPTAEVQVVAKGLNASPGAASGVIVFDADTAEERGKSRESVILVRWETTPDDFHGMVQAAGILTAHGLTSHAAVVARGMGTPCVTGCEALPASTLVPRPRSCPGTSCARRRSHDRRRHRRGDRRRSPLVPPQLNDDFTAVLEWADGFRRLRVRTNADAHARGRHERASSVPRGSASAAEHMFADAERLHLVREMILADSGRTAAAPRSSGCSRSSRATSRGSSRRWPACR